MIAQVGTQPTLSTTSYVATASTQFALTLSDCSAGNLVATTDVNSASFQLAQAVSTPDVYSVCLTYDSSSGFTLQSGVSFSKALLRFHECGERHFQIFNLLQSILYHSVGPAESPSLVHNTVNFFSVLGSTNLKRLQRHHFLQNHHCQNLRLLVKLTGGLRELA